MLLSRLLPIFLISAFNANCGQENGGSNVKIIGGIDALDSDFPEVVRIQHGSAGCSASFVSSQTLLTAAHCLEGNSGPVQVGQHSTNNYFMHPRYDDQWFDHDVAVVHFSEPISDVFLTVAAQAPAVGTELTIIGFGTNSLYGNGTFRKRYGHNKVERVNQGRIEFRGKDEATQAPAGEDVLSASGDSGGPMLVAGKQVAVSSAISVEPRGQGRNGYYTNLNYAPNRQFLKDLVKNEGVVINFED